MSASSTTNHIHRRRVRAVLVYGATLIASGTYCLLLLGVPPASWRGYLPEAAYSMRLPVYAFIRSAYDAIGVHSWGGWELRECTYLLLIGGLIPWLLLALFRRGRPNDLGFRRPNRLAGRLIAVGFLVALPFLIWLALTPALHQFYLSHLRRVGGVAFSLYYLCNMLSEHFVMHGLLLAVFRRSLRWPPPPEHVAVDTVLRRARLLQWLGLRRPTGDARGVVWIVRWIGLPSGCMGAMVGSTIMFSLVHVGKDPRELLLSVPGGMALAYLAYRTNSWLTPFVLHLATAGTACVIMVLVAK